MKLRFISLVFFQICSLSLFAMSPEEKAEFKRQVKAAQSSKAMSDLVSNAGLNLQLDIDTPRFGDWDHEPMTPLFSIGAVADIAITNKHVAVKNAVEEAFFEEMHTFIYAGGNIEHELAKFEKYRWANAQVVENLGGIFRMRGAQSTFPQDNELYRLVKNRVAEVTNENRIFGGKNDFSQKVLWTMHKIRELSADAL